MRIEVYGGILQNMQMDGDWNSQWISPGDDPKHDLGVFVFRREIDVEHVHARLDVRVSADQRYKLYANGELVGFGPQRGDAQHWFYETYDLAPYLRAGRNEIRAVVWNFGWDAPMAQMSVRTAFLLDDLEYEDLSTAKGWQVAEVPGWDFAMMHATVGPHYMDIGPGEIINAGILGADIASKEFEWREPHIVCAARERGADGGGTPWLLIPRSIPSMRYDLRDRPPLRRHGFIGDPKPDEADADCTFPIHLQPGEKILLDYGELLCAYPQITAFGEGDLTVTFAEACYDSHGKKTNRDHVKGMHAAGYQDKYIVSPREFEFETLWWRTYRYMMIEADGSASITGIEAVETGYPYEVRSSFEGDDPMVKPIWAVSVRTAERCAGETYFDCPYYEQLQYAGDTRIQALIGYYLSSDRALQRAAVKAFQWSTLDSGLTLSRYPSRQVQVIPPFSLWWLAMLADQRLYDRVAMDAFELEGRIEGVSSAFSNLSAHPERSFWNFADWVPSWSWGVPALGPRSTIHRLTEFYARLLNRHAVFENSAPNDPSVQVWLELERIHFEEFEKLGVWCGSPMSRQASMPKAFIVSARSNWAMSRTRGRSWRSKGRTQPDARIILATTSIWPCSRMTTWRCSARGRR